MKKYYLLLAAGALGCALASLPVLASDAPTDEGNYIWQDENGDFWWRNGSEDEYLGDGNYAPDPDSGELMEANDAGWTEQDGYFEPHYYYEDGSVWWENGDEQTYIGSRDQYYMMITEICRNFPVPHRMEMTATRSPLIPIVSLTIRSSARASST